MNYRSLFKFLALSCYMLTLSPIAFSQENPAQPSLKQSVSIKPVNFSNIDLGANDGFGGYHFGLEYERLIPRQRHWSFVLPVTYARYNTLLVMDYDKRGHEVYITPGIKYYLNDYHRISGYSISAHLMGGIRSYDYSAELSSGKVKGYFAGLLINNHYAVKIWRSAAVHLELGAGIRYTDERKTYTIYNGTGAGTEEREHMNKLSGIMNASLGLSFKF